MISIQITGIQGVGKTTVTNKLRDEFPELAFKDYADFMLAALGHGNKDSIGRLRKKERSTLYKPANQLLDTFMKSDHARALILESHVSIVLPDGSYMMFDSDGFASCNTKLLIIIEADPEIVYHRRATDETRQRESGTLDTIRNHQDLNRIQAQKIAGELNVPLHVVKNHELSLCVAQISELIDKTIRPLVTN